MRSMFITIGKRHCAVNDLYKEAIENYRMEQYATDITFHPLYRPSGALLERKNISAKIMASMTLKWRYPLLRTELQSDVATTNWDMF